MKTLYRQFIAAMLLILLVSIFLAFMLANFFYLNVTKEESDRQHVKIAEDIALSLGQIHSGAVEIDDYLESVAGMGYQVAVVDHSGVVASYGRQFEDTSLPEDARRVLTEGEIYHGMNDFKSSVFMLSHFSNELSNTVGVPFEYGGNRMGLFIRSDTKLISSDIHTVLIGFVAAVAIVSIIGMIWLAKQLTRPITRLTEATRQLAQENYSYPLNIRRRDEIGQLAASFNKMQEQLKHNDLARKSFVSNVSHDFQSPLMNIQGYADLLKSNGLSEAEQMEYLGIIDQEAKRLSNLTKQLLLLTSLDQVSYPMKYTAIQLDEQLKDIIAKFRWRLEEKDIVVSYKLPPIQIRGDGALLENVWENLFTNAIKYNKPGGSIEVAIKEEADGVSVVFRDTGIGIPEDAIPKLFDRFYRGDAARKKGGSGLGLSIVREVVSLHGGEVLIESKVGEGSCFTVKLPVEKT